MRLGRAVLHARSLPWSIARTRPYDTLIHTRHFADARQHPGDEVTEEQLDRPLDTAQPVISETPRPERVESTPKSEKEERIAKAQIVFGSRLAGPAQRKAELDRDSVNVAGVLVPPEPEEPDNCCMAGCVNCVWDRYREEFEEWAAKKAEAQARLALQSAPSSVGVGSSHGDTATHTLHSMDDDGGGSDTNWPTPDKSKPLPSSTITADPFAGIPVGIREFMKTEKMLKERHAKEAANG